MRLLTREGYLIEEQGMTYLAEPDSVPPQESNSPNYARHGWRLTIRSLGPLAGVKVIEMGQFIAGPFHGKILAEFGAEVISRSAVRGLRAGGVVERRMRVRCP
jgi:CoA-transferase family III